MALKLCAAAAIIFAFSRAAGADEAENFSVEAVMGSAGFGGSLTPGGKGLGERYLTLLDLFFEHTGSRLGLEYDAIKIHNMGYATAAYLLNLTVYRNFGYSYKERREGFFLIAGPFISLNYLDVFHKDELGKNALIGAGCRVFMGGKLIKDTPFIFQMLSCEFGWRYRSSVPGITDRNLVYFSLSTDLLALLYAAGFLKK
jgi:hypothetical protein